MLWWWFCYPSISSVDNSQACLYKQQHLLAHSFCLDFSPKWKMQHRKISSTTWYQRWHDSVDPCQPSAQLHGLPSFVPLKVHLDEMSSTATPSESHQDNVLQFQENICHGAPHLKCKTPCWVCLRTWAVDLSLSLDDARSIEHTIC
jgi:hypothetical protein